jgi:hypothetical protein
MLPELSAGQIEALERFRDLRIGFLRLRLRLWPQIVFGKHRGRLNRMIRRAELPTVRVTMAHIERAKAELPAKRLRLWADVLLMTDAYDWEGPDEDAIAEELNRLAWD